MFGRNQFNTNGLIDDSIVFDQNNSTSAFLDYLYVNFYNDMVSAGYGDTVSDLKVEFPNATWIVGNSANVDSGLNGTNGVDIIVDFGGNDTIDAGAGNDLVVGGLGNDKIFGGDGDDLLFGADGEDIIQGWRGNDDIYGGAGHDSIHGGRGSDYIEGEGGNDFIKGGRGHDTILGGDGNDTLNGNGGRDTLIGGDGFDILSGGNGRDTLEGGGGNDILSGGNGRDSFVFELLGATDRITDYDDARDKIELNTNLGVNSFSDIANLMQQIGNDVYIQFNNTDSLILENTLISDLDASDFDFFSL